MEFKDRLKQLRQEKGITQADLAILLGGLKKQTVSTWEIGRNLPSHEVMMQMCEIFGCTMDYLLCRTDFPNAISVDDVVNGQNVHMEVDKDRYPYGLTHEEVLTILDGLDKLRLLEQFKKAKKK